MEKGQATHPVFLGIPGGSGSKESTSIVGDLGSVRGWEDPLEEGMATHSSSLAQKFRGHRSLAGCSPWGHEEVIHD